MKRLIYIALLLLFSLSSFAQQLDQIGKKGGIKASGGIGFNNSYYLSDGETNRTSPYLYTLSGNANVSLYGWSIPFTVSYSNKKFTTGQPFNIVGMSPTYKSLTMHIGVRSMSFSPYTLAGHSFLGGGLEYTFQDLGLSVKAMGGRFLKAVAVDTLNPENTPTYNRYGGGLMLSYSKGGNEISLIGFHAQDDENSINTDDYLIDLRPQQNTVYSLSVKKNINSLVTIYGEGAFSAWTRNASDSLISEEESLSQKVFFISATNSTFYYNAYKAGIDLNLKIFTLGASYQRVEPEFKTLGSYNVANDFENISVNASTKLFKSKLSLQGQIGLQRDDLNDDKMSKMNRLVSSAGIVYKPGERLSLTLNYSGFNSTTQIKPVEDQYIENTVYDQLDTMNYIQLTQSFTGGLSYKILENDNVSHSISDNASYQKADNEQGDTRFGNSLINNSLAYSLAFKESGITLGVSLNGNMSFYDEGDASYLGLGINSSIPAIKKKLRISLGVNGANNYEDWNKTASLYSVNNSYSLRLWKNHSFNANIRYSGRQKLTESEFSTYNTNVNEWTFTFSYKYNFNLKRKDKVN